MILPRRELRSALFLIGSALCSFGVCAAANEPANADKLILVDCLLPGQVRRLGGGMNYLGPRRAVRVAASECEIRGGEYVAYDRADYATSLHVWLPLAQQGDVQAQLYVGEIYEKGMGIAPDYTQAAMWYEKAAKQGSSQGLNHSAYLYEQGLGVPKDPVRSLNLYRQAAGITSDELVFKSEETANLDAAQQQIDALSAQLSERDHAAQDLADRLEATRQELEQRQQTTASAKRDNEALRRQLQQLRAAAPAAGNTPEINKLKAELEARESKISAQSTDIARLQRSSSDQEQALRDELANVEKQDALLRDQLGAAQSESARQASKLADAQARAQAMEQESRSLQAREAATQTALRTAQDQLGRLQAARGAGDKQQSAGDKQQSEALRSSILKQQLELDRQKSVIEGLENQRRQADTERSRLEALASAAQKSAAQEKASAAQEKASAAQDKTSVSALEAQLVIVRSELLRRTQEQKDLQAKVDADTRQIAQGSKILNDTLAVAGSSDAAVQRLNAELAKSEATVSETRAKLAAADIVIEHDRQELQKYTALLAARGGPPAASAVTSSEVRSPEFGLGQSYALIVGNSDYPERSHLPPLKTAANDAREVDRVLSERYGFKGHTKLLINATRTQMIDALYDIMKTLGKSDNLVIYYAGHGALNPDTRHSYWLPIDADSKNPSNWISDSDVTGWISQTAARHVLLVADSCYSGPMTRGTSGQLVSTGSTAAEKKRMVLLAKLPSRTVLTSGGSEPVFDGGPDGHSIFAREFIGVLNRNEQVIEATSLYKSLFDRVHLAALRIGEMTGAVVNQIPQIAWLADAGHESGGEFLFVPIASPPG